MQALIIPQILVITGLWNWCLNVPIISSVSCPIHQQIQQSNWEGNILRNFLQRPLFLLSGQLENGMRKPVFIFQACNFLQWLLITMKLSFSCLWSQIPDIWCILLCSFFETAPSTEGAVPLCLLLWLLLICGQSVLEPLVLGTIKHWPSKLQAPRSQRQLERHTQRAENRDRWSSRS